MRQTIFPIPIRPWALNGISERMLVSHYENDYGTTVRTLNEIRDELAELDLATARGYRVRALKREEHAAMGSVALHELYFSNLGGDGRMTSAMAAAFTEHFGSVESWRREFMASARSLRGGSGWVLLTYSRRDRRLCNQIALDHAGVLVDATPVLVLDMYEHAYHIDFGANAIAYIDAFMRNINWELVGARFADAKGVAKSSQDADIAPVRSVKELSSDFDLAAIDRLNLPSITVEEFSAEIAKRDHAQVLDARPAHYYSRYTDMMKGAIWRDPAQIDEWSKELSPSEPVFVYCAYGFHVGCSVAAALCERGFDAKFLRGGLSSWYAAGGARMLSRTE
ncbi:MAG TPA: Fe-Mn family superoxide dismutase [Stellaceae bacterium]|nr:Fe-Mn family superoxide dismutase [Stellaceae bacterium]